MTLQETRELLDLLESIDDTIGDKGVADVYLLDSFDDTIGNKGVADVYLLDSFDDT